MVKQSTSRIGAVVIANMLVKHVNNSENKFNCFGVIALLTVECEELSRE